MSTVTPDPTKYYAYFQRGGRDAYECLRVVPEDVFRVLKEHEDELDRGNIPEEAEDAYEKAHDCEDIADEVAPKDYDAIPDDHFTRITVC